MMKKTFAVIIILAVIIVAVLATKHKRSLQQPETKITIRVPDTQFMGIMPLYVAEEEGFFSQRGIVLQWIDVKDPGQAGKVFFSGKADFLMTTFANLLPAEVRLPGTIRLLFPIYESAKKPGSYILVRSGSPVMKIDDLRGKTLGTYSGPSQKAYALMVLRKLGLKEPDDVGLVQVASSAQVQALLGGSFDALFTVEPYGSVAISKGARVIASAVRTTYISNPFWLGSGVIHTSFARQQPKAVQALLAALEQASEYIETHEAEAREVLARRTDIEKAVAERCALYTWVARPTAQDLKQIQEHADMLLAEKLLDKAIDVTNLFEGRARE